MGAIFVDLFLLKTPFMKRTTFPFIMLFFLASCGGQTHKPQEVVTAMQQYDRLIKKMDADSIALLYTADGDLGTMAHGRDSIRRFLASFKNVQVLEVSSSTDSLTLHDDSAFQSGQYKQSGILNGKDTFHVKGSYHTHWIWVDGEGWRIKKMTTQP
jgi:hypothetical protein